MELAEERICDLFDSNEITETEQIDMTYMCERDEQEITTSTDSVILAQENGSELKVPFDKIRKEISSTLIKGSKDMKATEKLYRAIVDTTKVLDKKYTDASNEQKEWKDVKMKLAKTLQKDKVILNVGGALYTTNVHTLTRINNSYFTDVFSENWKDKLDEADESFFIDRNGDTFAYILEYLRTNEVSDDVLNDEIPRHNLMIEARFFRLPHLMDILEAGEQRKNFPNSTLLTTEHKQKLNEFYGKQDQRWELIYKASRDGFDVNAFHTRCNNQGPTITIIQSSNEYLFGGYTGVAWTSSGNYANDTTAFLFTLTNPNNIPPTKYLITSGNEGNAAYHNSSYGPTFGSGHDVYLAANSNANNSSYSGFPNAYTDTTGHGNNTFAGSYNFTTNDIEVFKQA